MKDIVLKKYLKEKEGIQVKEMNTSDGFYFNIKTDDGYREYLILSEDERFKFIKEKIEDLIDEEVFGLKEMRVNIEELGNGVVRVKAYIDLDDVDISNLLSSYDGVENTYEYMGKEYYIYRQ